MAKTAWIERNKKKRDTVKKFAALRAEFTEPQLVELATAIAWENYRARFNRTFAILADGFSEGAFCPLPEA